MRIRCPVGFPEAGSERVGRMGSVGVIAGAVRFIFGSKGKLEFGLSEGVVPSMTDLRQLCSLPVAERLELVEDLWDSIAEEPGELRLTASHLAELDRRIDRIKESPEQGSD